jgi:transcriptional regulator with XRE-family HTH domain
MTISEKLSRLTEDMTKARIAKKAGVNVHALYSYMPPREQMPSAAVAFRLAKALGVTVEWLLDDSATWPPERIETAVPTGAHAA